jgi:hypothetical protein
MFFFALLIWFFFFEGCCIGILFGLLGILIGIFWATICCFVHRKDSVDLTGSTLPISGTIGGIGLIPEVKKMGDSEETSKLLKNVDESDMV